MSSSTKLISNSVLMCSMNFFHQLLGRGAKDYVIHIDLDDNDFPLASFNEENMICSPLCVSSF